LLIYLKFKESSFEKNIINNAKINTQRNINNNNNNNNIKNKNKNTGIEIKLKILNNKIR
jgi:hypothetical protein